MHFVIVNPESIIQTHIYFRVGETEGKKKTVEQQSKVVKVTCWSEELVFARSLYMFTTTLNYDIFIVRNSECAYVYDRSRAVANANHWLTYNTCSISLDDAVVNLDSAHLTITINVRPDALVFYERYDEYEEMRFENVLELEL